MQKNNPASPELNSNGNYQYIGDKNYPTLKTLLADKNISAKLSGLTGGIQGGEGLAGKFAYSPDSLVARVFEGFAGSHDFIGGQLPGFYDELGNASRNRTPLVKVAAEVWSVAAIPLATPFGLVEIVAPELLEFIFSAP